MRRNLLCAAVLGGFLALGAGTATAATPAGTPSAPELASIGNLAASQEVHDWLARTVFPHSSPALRGQAAVDSTRAVPVYEPTPEFVAGSSAVPAKLSYVAMPATTGNGSVATIWAHRSGDHWKVYNVASGDLEQRYAKQVGSGYLLHEPQINGWYAVNGDKVTALDGSATSVTLTDYQRTLHDRYSDKQPGSVYDRTGAGGGYGSSQPAEEGSLLPLLLLGGAVLGVAGTGALIARKARTQ